MGKLLGLSLYGMAAILAIVFLTIGLAVALTAFGSGGGENDEAAAGDFSGECTAKGRPAFGLPNSNVADREKVFGKANSPAAQKPVKFMGKSFQAHEKVVPCLEAVEKELKANGDDDYEIRLIGAYNPRPGEPLYFFHMYGAAIDINWDTNLFCACETRDIPDSWVKAFEKYGFFWGGNYRTKKDWMHFEWHGEKP